MDKILNVQKKIGVLVKTETNPFFKSKYLDINSLLEQLLPILAEEGLTVMQPLTSVSAYIGGETTIPTAQPALETIIYDGDKLVIKSSIPLPNLQDPQKMGSAITYYRRYALQSLFLLRAEDDDGNSSKQDKPDPNFARKNAEKDIINANNLDVLQEVEEKIKKSKILTTNDKEELGFLANERRQDFDPTK